MLQIIAIPTESLREVSKEIDRNFLLSANTQHFIQQLIATMYNDDGVGIAAPQVEKNIRICIIGTEGIKLDKKTSVSADENLILVNPVWTKTSIRKDWDTEGCLSVPKTYGKVKRYKHIMVKALDKDGNELNFEAHNFFARVIQHEVDHLDGILFIDKAKDIYEID
ncbi:MAG: peptide deformylase [Candidatus Magasanikbacteria bacterium]|jgi:peptide deformylase|nr:peptide deformylase [Candidatus Magasanikbacteria bacterium]MBT4314912.1 peptide deformylase [Candidatus Magasanikbacteria bacterium]MBT4546868.1 peptide deformylase [Candidatus Magasanikbacteria bacterium]MBT6819218.1 peptide deformylase [Candidatus Magasanikbacteria bacterium]